MTYKDILLKKHNVSNTEDFLKSLKQPINACPLIDSHLKKIIQIESNLDLILFKIAECPLDVLSETDFYRFYIEQFDHIKEYILEIKIILESHSSLLESFRGRCQSKREEVKELKKQFWEHIELKKEFAELPYAKEPFFTCVDTFCFSIEEISFEKHPEDAFYYDEYLKYIQLDAISFNYFDLKELLESLFFWGNDICEKMIKYSKSSLNQV